jgi:hypothetical protein
LALEKSGDYRHEPVERRPGCAAAAFAVPLLAPRHPRNGSGGRFADAQLATLTDAELTELERWLDVPDQQILAWVNGMEPIPANFDTPLFHRLRDIHGKGTA